MAQGSTAWEDTFKEKGTPKLERPVLLLDVLLLFFLILHIFTTRD
jgi:hypothetical protein